MTRQEAVERLHIEEPVLRDETPETAEAIRILLAELKRQETTLEALRALVNTMRVTLEARDT